VRGGIHVLIKRLSEKTIVPQNRFRSWQLWLSLAALIGFIVKTYVGYEIPEFDKLVNLALVFMTALGILNNPTDSTNF